MVINFRHIFMIPLFMLMGVVSFAQTKEEKKEIIALPGKGPAKERIVIPVLKESNGKEVEIDKEKNGADQPEQLPQNMPSPAPSNQNKPVKINEKDCPVV